MPNLRKLHFLSAVTLGIFLIIHISNHVVALWGLESHIAFMSNARTLYRHPGFEMLLLGLLLFQIGSGMTMLIRTWRERSGFVGWLQAISGAYLAFFLIIHTSSVLMGRYQWGLDTNFYFAAAGFHTDNLAWFFGPYYFLAVASLFAHIGCALFWNIGGGATRISRIALSTAVVIGFSLATLIVLALAGVLYEVVIPQEYLNTYM